MRRRILLLVCSITLSSLPVSVPAKGPLIESMGDRVKETTIFVPAQEMRLILGIEKEGIFVSYGEYKRLYQRAKEAYLKKGPQRLVPPDVEGPVIVQADYSGSVIGEVLQFEAIFKIIQNKEGPALFRFPLKEVGYQDAKLNGDHVQIYAKDSNPRIIIPGKGSHEVSVTFLVPIPFAEKKGFVSFRIPPAILGQITITSDLFYEVKLKDPVFASRRRLKDKVEIFGLIGARDTLSLEINNRRSFGEKKVKISSRETHHVFVEQNIIHRKGEFTVTVQDGMAQTVDIEIGKNDQVYSLSGSGVSGWTRETKKETDVLHVQFHVPISEQTQFVLKTYTYIDDSAPVFHLEDSLIQGLFEREGSLFVFYAKNTRITTEDVWFLNPLEHPLTDQVSSGQYVLHGGYRLFNLPYRLAYSLRDLPPRTRCHQLNLVHVERSKVFFHTENVLQGLVPGTTRFVFTFPEQYLVRNVTAQLNGRPVKVFHDHDEDQNRLAIEIMHPVGSEDEVSLSIDSERFLDEDRLKEGSFEIEVPVVSYPDTQQMVGNLHLSIDGVFSLVDMALMGYTPSDAMIDDTPDELQAKRRLTYAFRALSPEGVLTLAYRKSEQTSRTVSYIAVDQDILKITAYIQYEVSPGSQDRLYFAVPHWEGSKINIVGPRIKEKKKISFDRLSRAVGGADLPDLRDYDIWNVVLQKEVRGTYLLSVDYQKKIRDNGSFFAVPLVVPVGVKSDTGYIVLEASRDTEIRTEEAGLNEVETFELPQWPSYKPSNRIIESLRYFTRPFTFRIGVFRRDELPVLAAMAEREHIQYTLGKDSDIFFEFDYTIRNTNLQFLEIQLPDGHILWGATLQGMGIKPRKGENNVLLFPLPAGHDRINLRLVGYVSGEGKWSMLESFDFRSPRLTIPCMESQIRIFFPKDHAILGATGNFETLPALKHERPLLLSLFQRFFSPLYRRMRSFSILPPFGRRKARHPVSRPALEAEPPFEIMEEGTVSVEKDEHYAPAKPQALDLSDKLATVAPKGAAVPPPKHAKKRGLLSMHIRIPREGALLPASKLWGESRLKVTYLSSEWKRRLGLFAALLFIAFGFYLTGRGIMSPLGFLTTTLVLFTFLPLIFLKPLAFMFNGAVFGSVLFTIMSSVKGIWENSKGRARLGLIVLGMLLPFLLFASKDARAESGETFPDIELYVPYGERVPFELDDSHEVFVPTDDYFLLKFLAKPPYKPEEPFQYEREYTLTGLTAKGTIEGDTVKFRASLDVFVNHDKWSLIELPFSNVFVETLRLDGREIPVRISVEGTQKVRPADSEKAIYEVPVLGAGYHGIELVFYVEVEATRGKRTMAFGFPESLCTDFSLETAERDILLEFEEPDEGYYLEETGRNLVARASLSQRSFVKVSWYPRKFVKRTERPLVYADCRVDMLMDYDQVRFLQKTKIRVEKSSLTSMVFQRPSDLIITDVLSAEVKTWHTGEKNGQPSLEVVFKKEISETADLLIKAKRKVAPGQSVPTAFLEPVDAERIRGDLNLYGLDDHKIVVKNVQGLKISDPGESRREELAGFELQKRYSFAARGFQAEILSLPRARRVHAEVFGQYLFSEDVLTADFTVDLDVRESFITSIRLMIPEGFRIRDVHAQGISDYHFQDSRILVLPLRYAARGRYPFRLVLEKELPEFDIPTIEGPELLGIQEIEGRCVVLFPKGFDIREVEVSEMWTINIKSLSTQLRKVDEARFGAKYAYRFEEKPVKAVYEVSREKPLLDVVKVYHARVEDNLVNLKVLSLFTIKNAPVHHFDVLVPVQFKDSVRIEGEGIKTILKKTDPEGNTTRITLQTLSGIEGSYLMALSFHVYLGKDRVFEMPHVLFPQATSRTEFVSVERATIYQVETKPPEAFQEVDPDMVPAYPAGVNLNNVLWAYGAAGLRGWDYRLELKRLEREDLIKAMISREEIKSLVVPQGYAVHEVNFRVNNRVLQFLPLDFPLDAELWSLQVAGEPVRASVGETSKGKEKKRLLVPLIKSGTGDRSFDIRLVYMTSVSEFGLWGKINLAMVETGDAPVEKTTWTLFLPKSYSYPKFKDNMEEIDITVIEAEKMLDLAREYEYWTNLARTVKGGLRQRALSNRQQVMTDYREQQARTQQLQSDLEQRIGREQESDRQAMLQSAQSQNIRVLNEAQSIIQSNKPMPLTIERPEELAGEPVISERKNIQGWQFKTRDFAGQDEVERSVRSFFQSEDKKTELRKKQEVKRKRLRPKARLDVVQEEAKLELAPQVPAPRRPQKEVVQQRILPAKESVLRKGLRSMDIALPEQGDRHSFKKLGGNPTMTVSYRKKGILSKLFSLLVLLAVTTGTLRFRRWHLPVERIPELFKGKSLSDLYERFMRSRVVKVIPTLMMVASLFLGLPWFIMGAGLNTVLLLRYLSQKRYEKKGYVPSYNTVIFFKYLLSYVILGSSVLLLVTAFHPIFLVVLAVSAILNGIYGVVYAIVYLFTRKTVVEEVDESEDLPEPPPLPTES